MSILFSHPTGNSNVRALAQGLNNAGLLARFFTGIAIFPGSFLDRLAGFKLFKPIRRRRLPNSLRLLTRTRPTVELARLLAQKLGWTSLIRPEKGVFSIDRVYRDLDQAVAEALTQNQKSGIQAVYAYEDGALESFREAKKIGLHCVYDLPIGYWKSARILLKEEQTQWPEWAETIGGFKDSAAKLDRKDTELQLADHIFVASSFTAQSLKEYSGTLAPVSVIPYGLPPVYEGKRIYYPRHGKRLQVLFVGGLSQRKGIANLFAAVEGMEEQLELTLVGHKPQQYCPALELALKKHNYIPSLPHKEILALMRTQDVLLFPSLLEGFGLVITEAMSQGTPVITTERTAGPDLIRHAENGWLVKAGATSAIRETLENLLDYPDEIAKNGQSARESARLRPWESYGREMAAALKQILSNRSKSTLD